MADTLEYLAHSVSRASNLEELTRPMLELLANADKAMYVVKQQRRKRHV